MSRNLSSFHTIFSHVNYSNQRLSTIRNHILSRQVSNRVHRGRTVTKLGQLVRKVIPGSIPYWTDLSAWAMHIHFLANFAKASSRQAMKRFRRIQRITDHKYVRSNRVRLIMNHLRRAHSGRTYVRYSHFAELGVSLRDVFLFSMISSFRRFNSIMAFFNSVISATRIRPFRSIRVFPRFFLRYSRDHFRDVKALFTGNIRVRAIRRFSLTFVRVSNYHSRAQGQTNQIVRHVVLHQGF